MISQVEVTRDWAVTLASLNEPGLVLLLGDVAMIAASSARRLLLVMPWCKMVASFHRGKWPSFSLWTTMAFDRRW